MHSVLESTAEDVSLVAERRVFGRLPIFLVLSLLMHVLLIWGLGVIADWRPHPALSAVALLHVSIVPPATHVVGRAHHIAKPSKPLTGPFRPRPIQRPRIAVVSSGSDVARRPVPPRSVQRSISGGAQATSTKRLVDRVLVSKQPIRATNDVRIAAVRTGQVRPKLSAVPAPNPPSAQPDADAVAALLRRALAHHFHYPDVALENAWQGRVVIRLTVTANGTVVSPPRILASSGYATLDHAAIASAESTGQLSGARKLLAGHTLSFKVPVRFRLPADNWPTR